MTNIIVPLEEIEALPKFWSGRNHTWTIKVNDLRFILNRRLNKK